MNTGQNRISKNYWYSHKKQINQYKKYKSIMLFSRSVSGIQKDRPHRVSEMLAKLHNAMSNVTFGLKYLL